MIERDNADDGRSLATLCLDIDDLAAVLHAVGLDSFVDELIDRLGTAFRSYTTSAVRHLPRNGFSYTSPDLGLVEWMPAMAVGHQVAIKTVGYHPANPEQANLPSVLATTSIYDTRTGRLVAICEATTLTALRTGAVSAVMTNAMATPGSITLGVVGCGAQAVTQIHAISRIRTIGRLVVTDQNLSVAESLAGRLPPSSLPLEVKPEVVEPQAFAEVVPMLDVLCTCTSVDVDHGPVVDLRGAKPSLHINAVGSDFPGKVELPVDYLKTSIVVPDDRQQCLVEGESQQLAPDEVGPDMVAVLTDPANRELVNQRTVFDSTGWSYEDLVTAAMFMDHAKQLGRGRAVQLQHRPTDPYDPLEILSR